MCQVFVCNNIDCVLCVNERQAGRGCDLDDGVVMSETQDSSQFRLPLDADFVQLCSTTEGIEASS